MASSGHVRGVSILLIVEMAVVLLTGAQAQFDFPPPLVARCVLGYGTARGEVVFRQSPFGGDTWINGVIYGLNPNSLQGWHIHEGPVPPEGCGGTGGHFNPFNTPHGAPGNPDDQRHVGDLGNLRTDAQGVAWVSTSDRLVSLMGIGNIVGRSLVIHGGTDDLGLGGDMGSVANGNAGPRVGCCTIQLVTPPVPEVDDDDDED